MIALRLFAGATALLALIQVWCFGLALASIRLTQPLAIAGAAFAAVGAVLFAAAARRPGARTGPEPASRMTRVVGAVVAIGLLAWTAWVATEIAQIAWYRDPLRWDSLWYHVPAINEWVNRGHVAFYPLGPRFANVPDQVWFAGWLNFPMGVEHLSFFAFNLLGTDRLIDATNLGYWWLAIPALAVIGGRLGAPGPWPWVGGGLLFGVSEFVRQSATAYVDPAFGATVIAGLAAGTLFIFDRDRPAWWKALLLGMAVGLMIGAKLPGLPFGGVIAIATLAAVLVRDGWRTWPRQVWAVGLALTATIAVGGYWSIRNLVHTGNPIYPIQLQFGRKVLAQGYDLTGFSAWVPDDYPIIRPYPAWARMFVAWTQPDLAFLNPPDLHTFLHATVGGMGFVWLLAGIPAIGFLWIAALRRRDRSLLGVLLYLSITLLILLQVLPITWQARFTYWLHALGLPAIAWVLAEAVGSVRRRPAHLLTLVLGTGAIGVAVWEAQGTVALEWQTGRDRSVAGGPPRFQTALDLGWPWMRETAGFRELLEAPRLARGTWKIPGDELLNGVLALPLGAREIVVLPPDPTVAELDALARRGFSWVLWAAAEGEELPQSLTRRATRVFQRDGGRVRYFAIQLRPDPA